MYLPVNKTYLLELWLSYSVINLMFRMLKPTVNLIGCKYIFYFEMSKTIQI